MQVTRLEAAAERAAQFLRALAHPARLRVVCALIEGERTAGELAARAGLSAPALSQQAAVLEASGVVTRRRESRSVVYRLAAPGAESLASLLHELFCETPAAGMRAAPETPKRKTADVEHRNRRDPVPRRGAAPAGRRPDPARGRTRAG
jgi:DNA-binding transcriptional ArsR family regulator